MFSHAGVFQSFSALSALLRQVGLVFGRRTTISYLSAILPVPFVYFFTPPVSTGGKPGSPIPEFAYNTSRQDGASLHPRWSVYSIDNACFSCDSRARKALQRYGRCTMFEQITLDFLIVSSLFVLRVGVPIVIFFGIARWIERKLHPTETPKPKRHSAHVHAHA